jgi:hypothetical protein
MVTLRRKSSKSSSGRGANLNSPGLFLPAFMEWFGGQRRMKLPGKEFWWGIGVLNIDYAGVAKSGVPAGLNYLYAGRASTRFNRTWAAL